MVDCDCNTPLISLAEDDEISVYSNEGFTDFQHSDSSSGYDSSDVSDTESDTSTESRDSCIDLRYSSQSEPEVMRYQSTQALCENLNLIIAMPEMCDVTFLVGPREVPVHGVRAVMATRSKQFYNLILSHLQQQSETGTASTKTKCKGKKPVATKKTISSGLGRSLSHRLVIPVKKYEPEVFRALIQFVHCGSVEITEEMVVGLFCAAERFGLRDLSVACLDFVSRCLAAGRHTVLLSTARQCAQHSAVKIILDEIYAVLDEQVSRQFSRKCTLV